VRGSEGMIETSKIISYKKVKITEDEYNEYQKICRSYDRPNFKGEELFKDSFEVDDDGRIIYIKALGNKQSSFEVLFFIMNLMQNQWLRYIVSNAEKEMKKFRERSMIMDRKIKLLDDKLKSLSVFDDKS